LPDTQDREGAREGGQVCERESTGGQNRSEEARRRRRRRRRRKRRRRKEGKEHT